MVNDDVMIMIPAPSPDYPQPALGSIVPNDPSSFIVPSSLSFERKEEANHSRHPISRALPVVTVPANLAPRSPQTIIPETESPPRTLGMSYKEANAYLTALPKRERSRELRKEMREIRRTYSNSSDPTLAKEMAEKLRPGSSSRSAKSAPAAQPRSNAKGKVKLMVEDLTKDDTVVYDTDESPMDMTRANELAELVRNRSITELHVKCLDSQSPSPSLGG